MRFTQTQIFNIIFLRFELNKIFIMFKTKFNLKITKSHSDISNKIILNSSKFSF